jgi:hypothetical protein
MKHDAFDHAEQRSMAGDPKTEGPHEEERESFFAQQRPKCG